MLENLLQPPILFFVLGLFAIAVRSDLTIAQPIPRFLSLLLLVTIGLKGGQQLSAGGLDRIALVTMVCAVAFSLGTPVYCYYSLRRWLGGFDAAAVAATYGSVSAVTFITAVGYLQRLETPHGGHMVAALALMETPPIILALLLVRMHAAPGASTLPWHSQLHESVFNGSVLTLIGSFVIGLACGENGAAMLRPLTKDLFPILLSLFLLDMGLVAGRRIPSALRSGVVAPLAALLIPLINAAAAIAVAYVIGAAKGDALLLTVLAASASYIAVPAALRGTLPEANPGLYVAMSLALTFPFNVLVGIPVYYQIIDRIWS